jgi:phosphopantothenoylcysteine synthetase/decarboxylase
VTKALACGDVGIGAMADIADIAQAVDQLLAARTP